MMGRHCRSQTGLTLESRTPEIQTAPGCQLRRDDLRPQTADSAHRYHWKRRSSSSNGLGQVATMRRDGDGCVENGIRSGVDRRLRVGYLQV